jgi:thiamine pyrophosphate-dependent acetolactate synthase large subunit-like protein
MLYFGSAAGSLGPGARRSRAGGRPWNAAPSKAPSRSTQRVAWELSPRLPEGAIFTSDSGSCANWYARDLKIRRGMMCSLSGGLASMGAAVPYAIAAKLAHPDRPVALEVKTDPQVPPLPPHITLQQA